MRGEDRRHRRLLGRWVLILASVSAGWDYTCGVWADVTIVCWGYKNYGQPSPPAGEFASVSAGAWHTCGVRTDGSVACWGYDDRGQATPPEGEFVSVAAGQRHTCGVRRDSTVACWGIIVFGISPTGG